MEQLLSMPAGVVIDANTIKAFNDAYRQGLQTEARTLVERIAAEKGFLTDVGLKIRQEWFDACEGPFLREWYALLLHNRTIREIQPQIEAQHR